jgi:phosphatidylglycerol:prolipoprotein diacylglycerol transferase
MSDFHVIAYSVLTFAGILITALVWGRLGAREARSDFRVTLLYFIALFGALAGAKLAFLLAEGWHYRSDWLALLTGRSITGGLLGGYVAVEVGKKFLRYPAATGDLFAIAVPIGIMLGRVGCMIGGCCRGIVCDAARWWTVADEHGVPRWPAPAAELLFNAIFLAWALLAAKRQWQIGQRFHIYLIAYGIFRFAHEFLRDDQRIAGAVTGYHILALVIAAVGAVRYVQRERERQRRVRAEFLPTCPPIASSLE